MREDFARQGIRIGASWGYTSDSPTQSRQLYIHPACRFIQLVIHTAWGFVQPGDLYSTVDLYRGEGVQARVIVIVPS